MMINKTIQHAVRKISFDWDDSMPVTTQDEELLAAFLRLHDAVKEQKDLSTEIIKKGEDIKKETENLRLQLNEIKDLMEELNKSADELGFGVIVNKQKEFQELVEKSKPVGKKYYEYSAQLNQHYNAISAFYKTVEEFRNNKDDLSLWDEYSDAQSNLYNNFQNNSIDIKTFDEEDNRFKNFISALEANDDWIIDFSDQIFNNYNLLNAETKTQNVTWDAFKKRLVMIHKLIESTIEINRMSSN